MNIIVIINFERLFAFNCFIFMQINPFRKIRFTYIIDNEFIQWFLLFSMSLTIPITWIFYLFVNRDRR